MKLRAMLTSLFAFASLIFAQTVSAPTRGTVPRAVAEQYPAHAAQGGVQIGAALLSRDQVRKAFAPDVNHCCMVVEVALYPAKGHPLAISLDDFALHVAGSDLAIKPSSTALVAIMLQKTSPPPPDDHGASVHGSAEMDYGNGGVDPNTGQRTRGRTVSTSATAGIGVGGKQQPADGISPEQERRTIQMELTSESLPEGSVTSPVSGYLFFSVPGKQRKAAHQLEYKVSGNKVSLSLP